MKFAFAGNDVVDLAAPSLSLRAEEGPAAADRWRTRHLTDRERNAGGPFWTLFAVKEAAWKAFAQAGIRGTHGGFRDFEVHLGARRVEHRPSGLAAEIARLEGDGDRVHCVVVFQQTAAGRLTDAAVRVPAGLSPGDAAREALLDLAARAFGGPRERFAVAWKNGAPALLEAGRFRDASVSIAHSGRYAAASLLCPSP